MYAAQCTTCSGGGDAGGCTVYVGESSRPLRERVIEHFKNADGWNPCSFMIEHWLTSHGMEPKRPEFSFKIIEQYPDPLRRQLSEAIHIIDKGTLNRRMEFNRNILCRLQVAKTDEQQCEAGQRLSKEKILSHSLSL